MKHQDEFAAKVIKNLGGPTKVARMLQQASVGRNDAWTPQRVQNWLKRGIPAQVRLDYPQIISAGTTEQGAAHA